MNNDLRKFAVSPIFYVEVFMSKFEEDDKRLSNLLSTHDHRDPDKCDVCFVLDQWQSGGFRKDVEERVQELVVKYRDKIKKEKWYFYILKSSDQDDLHCFDDYEPVVCFGHDPEAVGFVDYHWTVEERNMMLDIIMLTDLIDDWECVECTYGIAKHKEDEVAKYLESLGFTKGEPKWF